MQRLGILAALPPCALLLSNSATREMRDRQVPHQGRSLSSFPDCLLVVLHRKMSARAAFCNGNTHIPCGSTWSIRRFRRRQTARGDWLIVLATAGRCCEVDSRKIRYHRIGNVL